ncbi:MAG: 50S ribosomal protein L10 [Eubacteriales bacterium]|nr:50S ribosomal protein L10 [Eubacteriales bacterium]
MPNDNAMKAKQEVIEKLVERLSSSCAGVLVDYRGLTVEEDTNLRRQFREAGVEYAVVKNTMTRFAAEKCGLNDLDPILNGPTALATHPTDVIISAKIIMDFAKSNPNLEVKSGFVEGKVISVEEVKAYAAIPSKEVLISKMLGSMLSPISALARTLQAIVDEGATSGANAAAEEAPVEAPAEAPVEETVEAPVEEAAPEAAAEEAPVEEAPAAE